MKKQFFILPALLILGAIILFQAVKPRAAEAVPEPTRHKVYCADGVNYWCEISIEAPYCDGISDPEWNTNSYECPVPRAKLLCPLGGVYYCDVSASGPPYCWEHGSNWDVSFGECPY